MSESQRNRNRTYLDVPFLDKDQAKALGARWDRDARAWYVPAGMAPEPFGHWLPAWPRDDSPLLAIVGLPQPCWKCGEDTMAVIACNDGERLVFAGSKILQVLASQLTWQQLAAIGAGPLRPRFSHTMGRSSWSNGCIACGALLGGFPLYEDFVACQADTELELPVVASARVPADVLYGELDPQCGSR